MACCSSLLTLEDFTLLLGIAERQWCAAGLRDLTNWSGSQGERLTTCDVHAHSTPSQGFQGGRGVGWVLQEMWETFRY